MRNNKIQKEKTLLPSEIIEQKIFLIRGRRVMLDKDLAFIYGVETRVFNQAVKRNIKRFPNDFMFQFKKEEAHSLRSQFVTLKRGEHYKYLPYVFTEQGVAMLSSVLNSDRAIEVNIQIIRTFVKLREMIVSNKELRVRLDKLEDSYNKKFKVIFDTLRKLLEDNNETREIENTREIGFKCKSKKPTRPTKSTKFIKSKK